MAFISYDFLLIFLPTTFLLYCIFYKNITVQNILLLVASFLFYSAYDLKYILFLLFSISITYLGGNLGAVCKQKRNANIIYLSALVLNLLILIVFKYGRFTIGNLNLLLNQFGYTIALPEILLPVGLSFFVFQSSTYLMDLRAGKVSPEPNIINYALFVSFFPTITSGPIQRSFRMLPQLHNRRQISFQRFEYALFTFLWGTFVKMVIADRLATFTNQVFSNHTQYNGLVLLICALLYSIQIYADFSGYSYMAIAIAHLFGFDMPDNFRQPYFATSIADFWRRWHISLTSWFTDYLYIPLGGNRKGEFRRYINIFIVFLVSGLWHGASWSFVVWGCLHATYQIVGRLTKSARARLLHNLGVNQNCASYRIGQCCVIFAISAFAWVFFRIESFSQAVDYIGRVFSDWDIWMFADKSFFKIGLTPIEWNITIFALSVLFFVSLFRERNNGLSIFLKQNALFRMMVYVGLLLAIVVFGMYGDAYSASSFIYAGF